MPNLKYSGSKGVVQSTGAGQFHVSGVGVAHDVETITLDGNKSARSYGVTNVDVDGANKVLTIPNPVSVSGAAGQQKLVVLKSIANGGTFQINSASTADLCSDNLTAVNDYALLVWTGTDWIAAAEVST